MQTSFPTPMSAVTFYSQSYRVPRRWPHSEGHAWCHSCAFGCLSSTGRSLVPFWCSESTSCPLPGSLLQVRQAGWARNNCNERLKVWKMQFSNGLIFIMRLCSPSGQYRHSLRCSAVPGDNHMAVTALPTGTARGQTTQCWEGQWCWCTPTEGTFLHGMIILCSCCRGFLNLLIPQGNFAGRSFSLFLCTSPAFNSLVLFKDCGTSECAASTGDWLWVNELCWQGVRRKEESV